MPLTAGEGDEQGARGSLLSWSMCFIGRICLAGKGVCGSVAAPSAGLRCCSHEVLVAPPE